MSDQRNKYSYRGSFRSKTNKRVSTERCFAVGCDAKFNQNPLINLELTPWAESGKGGFNLSIMRQFVFLKNKPTQVKEFNS
jgi:hypothetical protein